MKTYCQYPCSIRSQGNLEDSEQLSYRNLAILLTTRNQALSASSLSHKGEIRKLKSEFSPYPDPVWHPTVNVIIITSPAEGRFAGSLVL